MSVGEFLDDLFAHATGVLGWTPDVVMHTPIPQLVMAVEAKATWMARTNPFAQS